LAEEVVEEKSKLDVLIEALSTVTGALVAFLYVFTVLALLLYAGKLDIDTFVELVLAGGGIAAILKLLKSS